MNDSLESRMMGNYQVRFGGGQLEKGCSSEQYLAGFLAYPDDALRAVELLKPRKVIPIHYNTWPLIAQDAAAWAERVKKKTGTEAVVLKPGEWLPV
jgi:hypothetical protein